MVTISLKRVTSFLAGDCICVRNGRDRGLMYRGDIPQRWLDDCKRRGERLQATGDVEAYWKDTYAFEAEYTAVKEGRAQLIEAEAKQLRAEAASIRHDQATAEFAEQRAAPLGAEVG